MSRTTPLILAGMAAAALAAHSAAWAQKGPLQKLGKGEGQVDIVAWAGYIERGATDKNFDWVTDFEKKTGCKVNVKTAGTSDEMVALMNEGGFDLVTASGDASTRLIRGKKVQPINVNLIPSYKNVDPRLQKAPWHFEANTHYGVPYQWGWNVLMYNTKVFGNTKPTSWSVVFEETTLPDGKSNKGRVQAFDGPDLHRRRGAVPDEEEPGAGHQGPLRAERGPVQGRARPAARAAQAGRQVLARRLRADRRLHQRGRGRLGQLAVPGQHPAQQEGADRHRGAGRRRHRLGRHARCCTPRPSTRTAPTCGWSTR